MYTRYFGLTEKPFAIAPNPRYLFLSELHREALAHLLYGTNGEGCIILLTGDVGTGKTTACRCLIDQLPATTDIAMILNPKLTIADLLKTICEELKIVIPIELPSVKIYIDELNSYLLNAHSKGRNTAVIIDEAQNLDFEILEQLRLLTNLETNTHKLLQIVLIGQPELLDILSDPKLSQINQRITTRYHLGPLSPLDVEGYIQHRIAVAGGSARHLLFSPKAIKYITKTSKGIPRVINLLCDHALLGAYSENRDHVSLSVAKKAASEVAVPTRYRRYSTKRIMLTVALLLLGICLPVSLYFADLGDNIVLFKRNVVLLKQAIHQRATGERGLPTSAQLKSSAPDTNDQVTKTAMDEYRITAEKD